MVVDPTEQELNDRCLLLNVVRKIWPDTFIDSVMYHDAPVAPHALRLIDRYGVKGAMRVIAKFNQFELSPVVMLYQCSYCQNQKEFKASREIDCKRRARSRGWVFHRNSKISCPVCS